MSNWKNIWTAILLGAAAAQFILAMIAEYNEEYTKAVYEMMWAGLFIFIYDKELKDD